MKKKQLQASLLLFMFFLLIFFVTDTIAQTPQYYNYNNVGTSSNSFPFNVSGGKAASWLLLAGDLNQPAPLPPGQMITKVWFFITTGGSRIYTDLHILMAQDTINTFTQGAFYPGPWDTVLYVSSDTLTAASNSWMSIDLETPYPYDPTKSLIIFVGQCGSTGTGLSVRQNTLTPYRRMYSVAGCPFTVASTAGDGTVVNFGVDVQPAASLTPSMLFYKFEDNPSLSSALNCAIPGVGTPIAPISGLTLTTGGQFDTCITGTGAASAGVTTGFNWNLASSSWTISFWISATPTTTISYLFGDPGSGSFRCFSGGVAGADSVLLRGTGITDVRIGPLGSSKVVTFVYDSAAANIKGYLNGVLIKTISQTPLNMNTGTGFKVAGYSTSASLNGKMDEFRLYDRALSAAEISSTWNTDIPCGIIVGIANNNNQIPVDYILEQNYPNPFNPVTKITFALPKAGDVKLTVYDMLGQQVNVLVNEFVNAGYYSINFDASNISSGTYFYRLEAGNFVQTKKMQIIK